MPTAPPRPCLTDGCPVLVAHGSRCPEHAVIAARQRNAWRNEQHNAERRQRLGTMTERGYGTAWYRIVRQAISEQPYCSWCYATADLTGDHITRRRDGGQSTRENCRVLCRSCNSKRG